jgi:hypothetical protein
MTFTPPAANNFFNEAVTKLQFWGDKLACPASLNFVEKPGRTLVRFDRLFQEPTAQACSIRKQSLRTMRFSA